VKTNADAIVEIVCAVLERAAELIEQKNPTGKSLKQASEDMRVFAKKNQGKAVKKIQLP